MEDFDEKKFVGDWYELYRDRPNDWNPFLMCTKTEYFSAVDRKGENKFGFVQSHNLIFDKGEDEDEVVWKEYHGKMKVHRGRFKWRWKFYDMWRIKWRNLQVLATDYENYAILYDCRRNFYDDWFFRPVRMDQLFILTRRPLNVSRNPKERRSGEDLELFEKVYEVSKMIVKQNIPDYDFDGRLH